MNSSRVTKPLALLAALLVSSFCGLSMATPASQVRIAVHDAPSVTRNEVDPGDVAPPQPPAQPRPAPTQPPEPPPKAHPGCPACP